MELLVHGTQSARLLVLLNPQEVVVEAKYVDGLTSSLLLLMRPGGLLSAVLSSVAPGFENYRIINFSIPRQMLQ